MIRRESNPAVKSHTRFCREKMSAYESRVCTSRSFAFSKLRSVRVSTGLFQYCFSRRSTGHGEAVSV